MTKTGTGTRALPLLIAALGVLSLLGFGMNANADGDPFCEGGEQIGLGVNEVTGGTPGTTVYIDDRRPDFHGVWLYQESNGIWGPRLPGLYRGPEVAGVSGDLQRGAISAYTGAEDPCKDPLVEIPDTLIDGLWV